MASSTWKTEATIRRFLAKVDKTDEHWLWTAYKNKGGYGIFSVNRRPELAHRVSVELFTNVSLGDGDDVHHLPECGITYCVRPEHLQALSMQKHVETHKLKDFCSNGHELTERNTYTYPSGRVQCMTCIRGWHRASRRRSENG